VRAIEVGRTGAQGMATDADKPTSNSRAKPRRHLSKKLRAAHVRFKVVDKRRSPRTTLPP
jgi:hypothetical protein